MKLPIWADEVFQQFKPLPAFGQVDANPVRLDAWRTLVDRFHSHWNEVDAENWNMPPHVERSIASASILECAFACARHFQGGMSPHMMTTEIARLEKINSNISALAFELAELFRERSSLIEKSLLDDWTSPGLDPFDLSNALEAISPSIKGVFIRAGTSHQQNLNWGDLLDLAAERESNSVAPFLAIDLADTQSRKKVGWAPLARRFFVLLDGSAQLQNIKLRSCLSHHQTAALLRAAYGANDAAFNDEVVKAMIFRYESSRTIQGNERSES